MTTLLDKAIARARKLPQAEQDRAVEILLSVIERDEAEFPLTEAQIAIVHRTRQKVREGGTATATEMKRLWKRSRVERQ